MSTLISRKIRCQLSLDRSEITVTVSTVAAVRVIVVVVVVIVQ